MYTASGCIVFASYVTVAANRKASEWEERGIAVSVIIFVSIVHALFPDWGVRGMNILGVVKIGVLVFVVVTGLAVLTGGVPSVPDPQASFRHAFAGSATSSNLYSTALFKVVDSFSGWVEMIRGYLRGVECADQGRWSNAAYVMNEIKDPINTIMVAAPIGLSTCGMLFIMANVAYFAAGTPHEIASSGVTVASFFMGKVFGPAARRAVR